MIEIARGISAVQFWRLNRDGHGIDVEAWGECVGGRRSFFRSHRQGGRHPSREWLFGIGSFAGAIRWQGFDGSVAVDRDSLSLRLADLKAPFAEEPDDQREDAAAPSSATIRQRVRTLIEGAA